MVEKKLDVLIVGAGPAGLFCAYSLMQTQLKVGVFDKGRFVENRAEKEKLYGFGGAGTYSDGKLHLTPALSHQRLIDFVGEEKYRVYLSEVDSIFCEHGVTAEIYPTNTEEAMKLIAEAKKKNVKLIYRQLRHVGSDELPRVIRSMEDKMRENGIELVEATEITDLIIVDDMVKGVVDANGNEYLADTVVIAPGRGNSKWLQQIAEKHSLQAVNDRIYVGVRVEFPEKVLKRFADVMYESVFLLKTHAYDDMVRTFCVCPNGKVATERYEGFVCANGHSNKTKDSVNSNFALLSDVILTEPMGNTLEYGKLIAEAFAKASGNKPILQRLYDLKAGRRSTWERINQGGIEPTLMDVTPGDISLVMPARVLTNLMEAIHILERILPGLDSKDTLLYAPEIKMNSSRVNTDSELKTRIEGLYVAGDGAGVSGSITGAAASGLIVADSIKRKE